MRSAVNGDGDRPIFQRQPSLGGGTQWDVVLVSQVDDAATARTQLLGFVAHYQFSQIVSRFLAFERPPAAWLGMSNSTVLQSRNSSPYRSEG